MKISLNWIGDYVELPQMDPDELVKTITLSTCEVEGYELTGTHLADVVAAEVLEIEQHPDADKLSLVRVDFGGQEEKVVCGAKNFKVGDKVPYAGIGTVLPGGFKIKKAKIRGIESRGMLCAEDELGFSDDHEGLMHLAADITPGTPLSELFPDQVDLIMEIDNKSVTHRPDLWGHYGYAREVAAIFKKQLKPYNEDIVSLQGEGTSLLEVDVQAKDQVPRFSGLSVVNLEVKPSPLWMQHRLSRVGLRPINNLVDLTNYVMLDYGQPMHAFDADQVPGSKLIVKPAEEGEVLMTLYNKEAKLGPKDMVIYDGEGPTSVAGVIGGLRSGITDETTSLFIEAANWDPVQVRKTSTRIGFRTDAVQRFEKALDPEWTVYAIRKSVDLLELTCPDLKIIGDLLDIKGKMPKPIEIEITSEKINRRLGTDLEEKVLSDILESLGFTIQDTGASWKIQVPTWRATKDVSIPEDLIEEVGRIYGFNNITPKAPLFPIDAPIINYQRNYERLTKFTLSRGGYHEVFNYPLTCAEDEAVMGENSLQLMQLLNPVAENQNQMRTSLVPHFLKTIQENRKTDLNFKVYEIGRIYFKADRGHIVEESQVIAAVSSEEKSLDVAFYELKADLINLFAQLQLPSIDWKPLEKSEGKTVTHPFASAGIYSGNTKIGIIYALPPQIRDQYDINSSVCIAELNFDQMFETGKEPYRFKVISKFPPVLFDLSVLIPEKTTFSEIHDIIKNVDRRVAEVHFADLFYPKDEKGHKSLTVSVTFQSEEKTLDSEEVKKLQDSVIEALAKQDYHLR